MSTKKQTTGLTLSDATSYGRKALLFIGIGTVTYLILRMLLIAAVNYYKAMNPPPPPPPTVGFGRLPVIVFPSMSEEDLSKEYTLETARNRLPEFPDRAKVFEMEIPSPSLLADEKARKIASKYGFSDEPEMLDVNNYRWIKYGSLESIFEINLINYNFSLITDYHSRPELISVKKLPDKHEAVQAVKSYLKRSDSLPEDVATASGDVSYVRVLAGELLPAVSLSDANFVQVDINRVPVDNHIAMYTPEGTTGVVSAVISGALEGDDRIVQLDYRYQPTKSGSVHTYPLKPITQAWKELQSGEGYIASGVDLKKVTIRDVVLGYYEGFEEQSYLQPIYVFSGDEDFLAYIHAIDSKYLVLE